MGITARRLVPAALLATGIPVVALERGDAWPRPDRSAAMAVPLQAPSTPLRVFRALPEGTAAANAPIVVTFDRPVAGSLDHSIDPRTVLSIAPAMPGTLEWRDPVTIVFTPTALYRTDSEYAVTVDTSFRAMDGTRLDRPHRFTFRVAPSRLLGGHPVDSLSRPVTLRPTETLRLVWSGDVDAARLAGTAFIQLADRCAGERVVRVRVAGAAPLARDDRDLWHAGGWKRELSADSLRRVVTLVPARPLPLDCEAELVVPQELGARFVGDLVRWRFSTYGPLRLVSAHCGGGSDDCPSGPVQLQFSTPVRGSEVRRRVRIVPDVRFAIGDTARVSQTWHLDAALRPRSRYAVVADTSLRDVFGQRLVGNPAVGLATTGHAPSVSYPYGRLLVEREGFGTLAVQHVNVDTLIVVAAPVPDSLEGEFLSRSVWSWGHLWDKVKAGARPVPVPLRAVIDRQTITGVKLPALAGGRRGLLAVRIAGRAAGKDVIDDGNIALVQVTNLAVHAKLGAASGVVWVTRVSDGAAVAGATVRVHAPGGRVLATGRSDARGLATFPQLGRAGSQTAADAAGEDDETPPDGYVVVTHADDRALVGVSQYDPDLSPWHFGVSSAWGNARLPLAGAVFTERGIYRPGEPLHVKAMVRRGALGALGAPAAGDSVKWVFRDRERETIRDTVVRLSAFGTAAQTFALPRDLKLGSYSIALQYRWEGEWRELDAADYRVAEYRPPEFLVDVTGPAGTALAGDSLRAAVEARYLFGAPMARAAMEWEARRTTLSPWELELPGLPAGDWYVGESASWWEEDDPEGAEVVASGADTLDGGGRARVGVALPPPSKGRAARVTVVASVTDVNRQVVAGRTSVVVHPAELYVAAKAAGDFFWRAGTPQAVSVIAVRPDGERVRGIAVRGAVVRREWHQVHRTRDGAAEVVGEWVTDTVARCALTMGAEPARCAFTPAAGGSYVVSFEARDARGRVARTSFSRWASGGDWVPWEDESRFRMDVIPDRRRYTVGDTATVMLASPFTGAEAWVTVEREGIIEQRRLRLGSGSTMLRIPITEAFVPNAYVSVLVARGRSARPGTLDDPGRPTMRVGYAELRVTPEVKRLAVTVAPLAPEYLPGDSARVRVRVADSRGAPQRAEVTLWAVDEGVLALTGYRTPDPIDLLYRPRGLGLRLASNLVAVAPQIPEGEKGRRAPGGGGGGGDAEVLRSQFKTTAFFLGAVVTDGSGQAVVAAKLPDNLTTFRVMAVAVTRGDRYGSGDAPLLVTRALIARPALPRFLRPGDDFVAGTVVNRRSGGAGVVTVAAAADAVELRGRASQQATLAPGRGVEVRFPFRAPATHAADRGDTATFRFTASGGGDADGVRSRIPFRPDYHPRAYTATGVLHDTASIELALPEGIDPARSRVAIEIGGSVLALVRGAHRELRVYPWYCTEQVTSSARPLLALYEAERAGGPAAPARAARDLALAVRLIEERQRGDGGIGFWGADQWTSPWLSAYAGTFLLDARAAGIAVQDSVLHRVAAYVRRSVHGDLAEAGPIAVRYARNDITLAERVAAADFLSRAGHPDVALENQLVAQAAQLRAADRARLAEALARRDQGRAAAALLAPQWGAARIEGRRAVLPDSAHSHDDFYFPSAVRPTARLLTATLAVAPDHPLVGPLVESLIQQGRAARRWNTQDWALAVEALTAFERRRRSAAAGTVRVRAGRRTLLQHALGGEAPGDSSLALTGLLEDGERGGKRLRLALTRAGGGEGAAYYHVTVREVPQQRPVSPDDQGIRLERWYERFDSGRPVTSVVEGELVRVRLRVTVPADRQMVVVDDPLPAGLEAVDLSLRTAAPLPGPGRNLPSPEESEEGEGEDAASRGVHWGFGRWEAGWWTPFEHRELRDDRVVYSATQLWRGAYTLTYVARATTPGVFVRPPAHAEEMYNPAVFGRSDGGVFTVTRKAR